MLIDTHCHLNMMVKTEFDVPLTEAHCLDAQKIISQAVASGVQCIINVGTSVVESKNCVLLAQQYSEVYATIGIHPNDCTADWKKDLKELKHLLEQKEHHKIVGIGETGIDRHYPDYDLKRQVDAFRAQIELALEYECGLVIHSRNAYDETLRVLDEYAKHEMRAVMHCFSYDQTFAEQVISWGFKLGIGGTITYPKNNELREVVKMVDLDQMVLETDAPFLPIQSMRGKRNSPQYIKQIAEYIAELRQQSVEQVAEQTTKSAQELFRLPL